MANEPVRVPGSGSAIKSIGVLPPTTGGPSKPTNVVTKRSCSPELVTPLR